MARFGFGFGFNKNPGKVIPSILYDGNTVAWFDAQENITKDGANLVSAWNSRIGANHLLQATGTNQPLWSANGILFDGIDNFMKCVAFTWNQPEFIYMVVRQVTWTAADYFFDGDTVDTGIVYQQLSTPNIRAYAGTLSLENDNLAVNTWGIVRCLLNGASSKLIINNTTPVTGNFGASNMSGFTLGSKANGISWSYIEVAEIIGRSATAGEADILAYLQTKYAAILP